MLNKLVVETEVEIKESQAVLETAEAELTNLLETSEGLKGEYNRLLSWADLHEKSTFEAKKMIVSQFIKLYVSAEILTSRLISMSPLRNFRAISKTSLSKMSAAIKRNGLHV